MGSLGEPGVGLNARMPPAALERGHAAGDLTQLLCGAIV